MTKQTIFAICAPSGTGKTTLCRAICARANPNDQIGQIRRIERCVSHTTRLPRPGEQDGIDYHFTSREQFEELRKSGGMLEHAEYAGNLYGISRTAMRSVLDQGRNALLDVEIQGAKQLRTMSRQLAESVVLIFLKPPSREELLRRLESRGTEDPQALQWRIQQMDREIQASRQPGLFDHVIVNENLEKTLHELNGILYEKARGTPEA